ncbi:ArsC/Spx/MgsR family protein [Methylomagnum sp.]
MAKVRFWEKPGCITNTRQKQWLREAGHTLIEHNLLTEPWDADTLRAFFGPRPVAEWFNRAAPAVKEGRVIPERLDADEALRLMLAEPLLIRRPLMQVGERREVGFDTDAVDAWIGLMPRQDAKAKPDLESCPRESEQHRSAGGCQ